MKAIKRNVKDKNNKINYINNDNKEMCILKSPS